MSYRILPPNPAQFVVGLRPAVQPHNYPLVPLSQVSPVPVADDRQKKLLLLLLAVLAVLVVVWMVNRKPAPQPMSRNKAARKLSTPELAKNLYERLERRGGANETVMRSLKSYSSQV